MSELARDDETIQAYIAGRLPEPERLAFEERCARDPGLVRTMEQTLRLREGLEVLRERGQLAGLVRAPRRSRSSWLFAVAAAAGVATIAVLAALQFFARSPIVSASLERLGLSPGGAGTIVGRYEFAAMRHEDITPVLDLPVGGALEIRVLTSTPDKPTTYRSTLEAVPASGTPVTIGMVMHLVRGSDGFVAIYADAARLAPGTYAVSVTPEPDDGSPPDRFAFTLRRTTADVPAARP